MQEILRKWIRSQFDVNPLVINGETMSRRRQEAVDWFNAAPGFGVMILSPKAAGTGLTITSANHVIHYTRWWNPAVENQATDRVYRIGQEKPVTVYHLIVTDHSGMLPTVLWKKLSTAFWRKNRSWLTASWFPAGPRTLSGTSSPAWDFTEKTRHFFLPDSSITTEKRLLPELCFFRLRPTRHTFRFHCKIK